MNEQGATAEANNKPEIVLSSNETLDSLIGAIAVQPHDWDSAAKRFSEYGKRYGLSELPGRIADVELNIFLENNSERNNFVIHNPIPDGVTSGIFIFKRIEGGGYEIWDTENKRAFVEYDALILAGGMPVVFELKLGNTNSRPKRGQGNDRSYAVSPQRVKRVLEPLKKYFDREDFGYVVIIPSEFIKPESSTQDRFMRMGGKIVPFPMAFLDFRLEILRVKSVHKL